MRGVALLFALALSSCTLLLERLGEECQPAVPRCEGDISVQCINGVELHVQCDNLCEPTDGLCASCGDGRLSGSLNEECDDGNDSNTDSCKADCTLALCGDGIVDPNSEQCDDGGHCGTPEIGIFADQPCLTDADCIDSVCFPIPLPGGACDELCRQEVCGNGILQPGLAPLGIGTGEDCDDGNTNNQDGCSSTCSLERCGDGAININTFGGCIDLDGDGCDLNEFFLDECDDGNADPNDDCTDQCRIAVCGDRIVRDLNFNGPIEPGDEECDDGKHCDDGSICGGDTDCATGICQAQSDDGCSSDCRFEFCGDGVLQPNLGPTIETLFSQDFTQGEISSAQCTEWNDFRANLDPNISFTKITLRGTLDPVGPSCQGEPAEILCDALHNGAETGNVFCDGLNWKVGVGCGDGGPAPVVSLGVGIFGDDCGCNFGGRVIRPCAGSDDWGGVGIVCDAESQTMEVLCEGVVPGSGEACDDGNRLPGDGCDEVCQNE